MPKKNPIGIGISPKIQPQEPTRTPEEEHNLLCSHYMGLNAHRNTKQRAPNTPEIERSFKEFKEKGGLGKVQTRSEDAMFLQGNCYNNEKAQKQAFSQDKDERQGFINEHCATCPIKSGCLNYALERPNDTLGAQGVWGGTHPEERAGYRRSLTEGLINPLDTKWFPEYKQP